LLGGNGTMGLTNATGMPFHRALTTFSAPEMLGLEAIISIAADDVSVHCAAWR
jgi:hypothetical protein